MDESRNIPNMKMLLTTVGSSLVVFIISFAIFKWLYSFAKAISGNLGLILSYIGLIIDIIGELSLVIFIFTAIVAIVFAFDRLRQ